MADTGKIVAIANAVAGNLKSAIDEHETAINELEELKQTNSITGNEINISDGIENVPIKQITLIIEPSIEGTGDPSPTNKRSISGYSDIDINRSGEDTSDPTVFNIDFGGIGTVYNGTLDVTKGQLTVTHKMVVLDGSSDENWDTYGGPSDPNFCMCIDIDDKPIGTGKSICNEFKNVNRAYSSTSYGIYCEHESIRRLYFRMPSASVNSKDAFLTWIASNPIQILYEIENPVVYQIDPVEIKTVSGDITVIWSDSGIMSVDYYCNISKTFENIICDFIDIPYSNTSGWNVGYINTSGAYASLAGWRASGYIYLNTLAPGDYILCAFVMSTAANGISFYNSSKTYISGIKGTINDELYERVVKIPENAKFIRLCFCSSDRTSALNDKQYAVSGRYITQKYIGVKDRPNINSKRWCVLGDSRSANNYGTSRKYFDYIADEYTGVSIENKAVSGARMSHQLGYAQNIEVTPDIISVYAGVNDWGQTNPTALGTVTDATTASTFYGYTKALIEYLIAEYPGAFIFFITPVGQVGFSDFPVSGLDANALGFTLKDYCEAVKECCGIYSIPVYDDAIEGGYTPLIASSNTKYFLDGLHQNNTGQMKLAENVHHFLKTKYVDR